MPLIKLTSETIALSVNNTFVGTFFAGMFIALIGLRLYKYQVQHDLLFRKKTQLVDLGTILLRIVTVAAQDVVAQIEVHDGNNTPVKVLFNQMDHGSKEAISNDISLRFNKYSTDLMDAYNNLNTPLLLEAKHGEEMKALASNMPVLTLAFATVALLDKLPKETLLNLKNRVIQSSEETKAVLKKIINE